MGGEQHSRRRLNGDRGTALVESAIVLPFLVIMVFGIVEVGFLFRSASVVASAARSGARLAAAQYAGAQTSGTQTTVAVNVGLTIEKDLQSRGSTDTPVQVWIFKADNNGDPPPGDYTACASNCFILTWNTGTGHFDAPTGGWASPDGCGKALDSVGVWVQVTHVPLGFATAFGTISLKEKTVMRLEPRTDCTTPE